MKLSAISRITSPAFKGYEYVKNSYGEDCYYFSFPHDNYKLRRMAEEQVKLENNEITEEQYQAALKSIETEKREGYNEICELQLYRTSYDDEGNIQPILGEPVAFFEIPPTGLAVNLNNVGFAPKENFAYRYVKKSYNGETWRKEDVLVRDPYQRYDVNYAEKDKVYNNLFNVVNRNALKPTINGNGVLGIPDGYSVGHYFKDVTETDVDEIGKIAYDPSRQKLAEESRRTFSLDYGGGLAGIIAQIPHCRKLGANTFFSLPIFGGDSASYHKYWNENNFQLAAGIGDLHNYEDFVAAMFEKGQIFVLDAPLTSEGMKGLHYQRALRWSNFDTSMRHRFRMDGLKDSQIGYGIIGKNSKNLSHYLVNAPHKFKEENGVIIREDNPDYDSTKDTYIQYFDDRYVSEEVKAEKQLIKRYDVIKQDNPLANASHDDTVIKYHFRFNEANYEAYLKNIETLNEINKDKSSDEKISMYSKEGTEYLSNLTNTRISEKTAAGVQTWDANTI